MLTLNEIHRESCIARLKSAGCTRQHPDVSAVISHGCLIQIKVEQHLHRTAADLENDLDAAKGILRDERDSLRVAKHSVCALVRVGPLFFENSLERGYVARKHFFYVEQLLGGLLGAESVDVQTEGRRLISILAFGG